MCFTLLKALRWLSIALWTVLVWPKWIVRFSASGFLSSWHLIDLYTLASFQLFQIFLAWDTSIDQTSYPIQSRLGIFNWSRVFDLWCWRRLLRVPWTARRSKQSLLREIHPEYSLEGLMLKVNKVLSKCCCPRENGYMHKDVCIFSKYREVQWKTVSLSYHFMVYRALQPQPNGNLKHSSS